MYTRVDDQQYAAEQPLTNGSTLRLQLVFDQAAIYGWLVVLCPASLRCRSIEPWIP